MAPGLEPEEASLYTAWRAWQGFLNNGALDTAVRVSASYHPRYHFLESRLHTERGYGRFREGDCAGAEADFRRAIVLDHINAPALASLKVILAGSAPPVQPYTKESFALSAWGAEMPSHLPSIHALALSGRLSEAIALCDATHRQYHRLAALPWLARAKAFAEHSQRELAKNDVRRGLDLDRENAELCALLTAL